MCKKTITDRQNREITLIADDDFMKVVAFHNNREIGSFEFDTIDDEYECWLKVLNMHLEEIPGFTRCGIGTQIVDWVEHSMGLRVVFGRNDGHQSEDGSHLTGDGPAFAAHIYSRRKSKG